MNKVGSTLDKTAPVLTTARLRLRPMEPGDLDALCAFWCNPENVRYFARALTRDEVAARIDLNRDRYRQFGYGRWAVTLATGELIGDCGLIWQDVGGRNRLEVGYVFRKDQWGNGYATEAARACMEYAFQAEGSQEVIALVRPENTASAHVAERLGMKIEGTVFWHSFDHLVFKMERSDGQA